MKTQHMPVKTASYVRVDFHQFTTYDDALDDEGIDIGI
jgi:hypothetical protein